MHNKESQIAGMKMICRRNYKIPDSVFEQIDFEGIVDEAKTYAENFAKIKAILLSLLRFSPLRFRLMRGD